MREIQSLRNMERTEKDFKVMQGSVHPCMPHGDNATASCRDMLDSSPGVNWGDIAGLAEAKRVLQENVILPLYMPEFFQGIRRPVKVHLSKGVYNTSALCPRVLQCCPR